MGTSLMDANREWANRPADERYATLADLRDALETRRARSKAYKGDARELGLEATGGAYPALRMPGHDNPIGLTHWSFGQLAATAKAPAGYLRSLPAPLAVDCLKAGLASREWEEDEANSRLLVDYRDVNAPRLRALTSDSYGRVWDDAIVSGCMRLQERSGGKWRNPPTWDGSPGGLYASDRDLFIFLCDGGSVIEEPGGFGHRPSALHRGFFVRNSETGAGLLEVCMFLFRVVCGNHVVWDAEDVTRVAIRHNSKAATHFDREAYPVLVAGMQASDGPTRERITRAMQHMLPKPTLTGLDKDKPLLDWLRASPAKLTTAEARGTIELARAEEGDARTLWQVVNGATAHARRQVHQDQRNDLERRAARLMKLAA